MKPSTLSSLALVAFSHIAAVTAGVNPSRVVASIADRAGAKCVQVPSDFPKPGGVISQGCFSSGGNLTKVKEPDPDYHSSGSCSKLCIAKKAPVMALHGAECLCGDFYPPENTISKDSKCNYPCPGYDLEACGSLGSPGYWSVWNVGIDVNAPYMPDEEEDTTTSSSKAATSTKAPTSAETAPAATATDGKPEESEGSDGDSDEEGEKKSGPNTGAIAGGVVVGVVAVAAGIGGFFFWMRRRRNAEIEEDHRRNAAVNAFINGSKPPSSHGSISMTDSRLDPVLANRRMSDGSIADNEDYSRRILRVTNA